MNTIRNGAGWAAANLVYAGKVDSQMCQLCNAEKQTVDHLIWDCPRFRDTRCSVDDTLGQWGSLVLTGAMKIGIFPPLMGGLGKSYWGCHRCEPWASLPQDVMAEIGMETENPFG